MDFKKFGLSDVDMPEKEKKILMAAIEIFSTKGFSGSTTNEIAKAAGVAEGTIFRYFKTKKDILRGILVQAVNIFGTKIALNTVEKIFEKSEEKDIRVVLKELLYDRLHLAKELLPMTRVLITEALYHEDVRDAIYRNIVVKALEVFERNYDIQVEKGILRADVEPIAMFRSVMGNFAMIIAQSIMFPDKMPIGDIDAEFDKMLDVVLSGIAVKK